MANLKDIAEKAGVSIRTVARVLQDHPHVSADKRALVRKTVAQLGYRPNMLARALKTRRTMMIGVISSSLDTEVMSRKISSICTALSRAGYRTTLGLTYGVAGRIDQFIEDFSQFCDGIVFAGYSPSDTSLCTMDIPFVLVDTRRTEYPSVFIDRKAGVVQACDSLRGKYERYVFLTPNADDAEDRRAAFDTSVDALGSVEKRIIVTAESGLPGGYSAGDDISGMQRTLVVCYSDKTAVGLLKRLYELTARIPEDIGVIGFDDDEYPRFAYKSLSTVTQPTGELADEAVAVLTLRMNGEEAATRTVKTSFIARESTGNTRKNN
ncbi:MAG: LacI family DNA-binding transcriptional regulator [Spirochaetota bacterium]